MDYNLHPQCAADQILGNWQDGKMSGYVSSTGTSWEVRCQRRYLAHFCPTKFGGKQMAYDAAVRYLREYSDANSLTRNQWRIRKASDDGKEYGEVKLTKNCTMLFDLDDLCKVQASYWCASGIPGQRYGRCGKATHFHNLVTGIMLVDHINKDSLDNRKRNLRATTTSGNLRNCRRQIKNKSGITGVCYTLTKTSQGLLRPYWIAQIWVDKRHLQRRFSCSKYGNEAARQLAIKTRKQWDEEYGFTPE